MITLAALAILGQAEIGKAPTVPTGASTWFQQTYAQTVGMLEKGDFDGAAKLATKLPSYSLVYSLDDSSTPPAYRNVYRSSFNLASENWARALVGFHPVEGANPNLKISFSGDLPKDDDNHVPKAAVFFESTGQGDAALEAVFGTRRMEPPQPVEGSTMVALSQYTIGRALGLADTPGYGATMFYSDAALPMIPPVTLSDVHIAYGNIHASDVVREAIKKHKKLHLGNPIAMIDRTEFDGQPIPEGDLYSFTFLISNQGDAPLSVRVEPDCSCFSINQIRDVPPGETGRVDITSSTLNFQGPLHKSLRIFTNDPDHAVTRFVFNGFSMPNAVVVPESGAVLASKPEGVDASYIVFSPSGDKLDILTADLSGLEGKVSFTPWTGEIGDPDLDIKVEKRTGYRVTAHISTKGLTGFKEGQVVMTTNSKASAKLVAPLKVQAGFAVLPEQAFFGTFKRAGRSVSVDVTRVDHPFKILSIKSSQVGLSGSAVKIDGKTWRVSVIYDGTSDFGELNAELVVTTDDPANPTVSIPVAGLVR